MKTKRTDGDDARVEILLNRYRLEEEIGHGLTSRVYRAFDLALDRSIALKIFSTQDESLIQSFRHEFQILTSLRHRNLVEVYDFGATADAKPFFTMEFIEGSPLSSSLIRADGGAVQYDLFTSIALQVARVLDYIHRLNILHGDIKPSNVFVLSHDGDTTPTIKLMDFGLSALRSQESSEMSGTIHYMSPEMISGGEIDGRSDLYALGVVLYETLAGRLPFDDSSPREVLRMHLSEIAPPMREIDPSIPHQLSAIVHKLLEKNPAHRYHSAFELVQHLSEVQGMELAPESKSGLTSFVGAYKISRDTLKAKAKELIERSALSAQTLLLEGENGVGKSQLLREMKSALQLEGAAVHFVSCTKGDAPLRPLLPLILSPSSHEIDAACQEDWEIVTQHFSSDRTAADTSGESREDATARFRLLHALTSVLLCKHPSLTIFLDDVHHADSLTAEFLASFIASLEALHRASVFLAISGERGEAPLLFSSLEKMNGVSTLTVQPFTLAETTEYLQATLGKSTSQSYIHVLHRQTGGNPLYLEEMLAFSEKQKIIERTMHGWIVHEQENLARLFPASLTEAVVAKLVSLDDDERQVLSTVALSPIPVSVDLLGSVTQMPIELILYSLRELEARHFLVNDGGAYRIKKSEWASTIRERTLTGDVRPTHDRFLAYYREKGIEESIPVGVRAHHAIHSTHPHDALPLLHRAAEQYERLFDYAAATHAYRDALRLTDEQGNHELRFALMLKLIAMYHATAERTHEWDALEEAMVLAAQSHEPEKLATIYRMQTEYYATLGEYDRARKSAERALAQYEAAGNVRGKAQSLVKIGWTCYRKRQGEELKKYYEEALALFATIDAKIDEGDALVELGLAHYSVLGAPETALAYLGRARGIFESINYLPGVARALGNSGLQSYHLGKYDDALTYYERAQAIYRKVGDRRGVAIACNAFGQALLAVGRYSEALRYLEEGLSAAREIRDRHAIERNLENLGELHATLGNYTKALKYYSDARIVAQEIDNTIGMASIDIDIAAVSIELREQEKALKLLTHARDVLADVQDMNVRCWLEYRFGVYWKTQNDHDALATAIQHFQILGETADQHGFDALSIIARSFLGSCHASMGNTDRALEFSDAALELLRAHPAIIGGDHDVLFHHAKILKANKRHAEAAAYFAQAHDSLLKRASSISESELYRSFLENVRMHAEIIREYASIHRTDSIHAVAAVREQNLKTLYEVSRSINSILDLPTLLDTIMDQALQTMNGERGLIFLIENNQLVLKAARNVESETIKDASEISLSIMNDVIHGGKPIVVSDAQQDSAFKDRQSVKNFKIHSLMCVPMHSRDKMIGTVYVDSRTDAFTSIQFTEIDMEFLEAFSNLAAIAIDNAQLHDRVREENLYLRSEVSDRFAFENIVGQSKPMQRLFQEMKGAIASDGNVLIMGESGTGKELVARAIHYQGPRKTGHFVPVDCGALPDTLLESELFGYKKGAFTGAYADKRGLFEEAHLGTLFLDEIANTSLAFQARLLRVLQEGEYRRVGDTESRFVDVRIVCATNKDLKLEIDDGRFRQDLFFRLNVIPITVPPLRERRSDIALLVQHFIDQHNKKNSGDVKGVSKELVDYLTTLAWAGNVREIENLINRMLVYAAGDILTLKHLPEDFTRQQQRGGASGGDFPISFRPPRRLMTLQDAEREHINYVLQHTKGNKTEAAKILNMKRTTLVERMKKLGMM